MPPSFFEPSHESYPQPVFCFPRQFSCFLLLGLVLIAQTSEYITPAGFPKYSNSVVLPVGASTTYFLDRAIRTESGNTMVEEGGASTRRRFVGERWGGRGRERAAK